MGLDTKTYWLTDSQSQCDFDFDFDVFRTEEKPGRKPRMGALYQDGLADWPSVVT
jgi:hypothetical protein